MLKFYYSGAPNPTKIALFLEESGLPYDAIPVDTRKGDQHKPEYRALNPNAKVPAIVDGDAVVFDSNAILLYLAEKTGKFLPESTPRARGTNSRISGGWSMRSARDRPPSAPSHSKTSTSSRPRWTVRRLTRCSPT